MKRIVLIIVTTLMACTASFGQGKTVKVDYKESSARTLEPTHQVFSAPIIVDLEIIGERVSYIETDAFADYLVNENIINYISDFKKVALGRAVKHFNVDAFVGTVFDVYTDKTGHISISVSGYPAKYTNFRNATMNEITLIQEASRVFDNSQNKVVLESPDSILKKEKTITETK